MARVFGLLLGATLFCAGVRGEEPVDPRTHLRAIDASTRFAGHVTLRASVFMIDGFWFRVESGPAGVRAIVFGAASDGCPLVIATPRHVHVYDARRGALLRWDRGEAEVRVEAREREVSLSCVFSQRSDEGVLMSCNLDLPALAASLAREIHCDAPQEGTRRLSGRTPGGTFGACWITPDAEPRFSRFIAEWETGERMVIAAQSRQTAPLGDPELQAIDSMLERRWGPRIRALDTHAQFTTAGAVMKESHALLCGFAHADRRPGVEAQVGGKLDWTALAAAHSRAREALAAAVGLGPSSVDRDAARAAAERGDWKAAEGIYSRNALLDDADAQLGLGLLYSSPDTPLADAGRAMAWLRRAADHDCLEAAVALGALCLLEESKPIDHATPLRCLRRAAVRGSAEAQAFLGRFYEEGLGVGRDYREALAWYRRAADKNSQVAELGLGGLYAAGLGVARDDREAARWYERAARKGNGEACLLLADILAQSREVIQDPPRAFAYVTLAEELETEHATELRARLEARLSETDKAEAARHLAELRAALKTARSVNAPK